MRVSKALSQEIAFLPSFGFIAPEGSTAGAVGDLQHFLLENAGLGDGASPKMAPISVKLHLGVRTQQGEWQLKLHREDCDIDLLKQFQNAG